MTTQVNENKSFLLGVFLGDGWIPKIGGHINDIMFIGLIKPIFKINPRGGWYLTPQQASYQTLQRQYTVLPAIDLK